MDGSEHILIRISPPWWGLGEYIVGIQLTMTVYPAPRILAGMISFLISEACFEQSFSLLFD
jgi:hypothetical protein